MASDPPNDRPRGRLSRSALLSAGALGVGGAAAAAYAFTHEDADSTGDVARLDHGSDADINEAIDGLGPKGALLLGHGDFVLERPILLPSHPFALIGLGRGVTTLDLAPKANVAVMRCQEPSRPSTNLSLQSFTVDGHRAEQGVSGLRGIDLSHCSGLTVSDIEVREVAGDGIVHIGLADSYTEVQWWNRILSHSNNGRGIRNSLRTRKVHYSGVMAIDNGGDGILFDHSECLTDGILAADNRGRGIVINNVYRSTYTNLAATDNAKDGIHVTGLVSSMGSSWRAQNNGSAGGADAYFSADGDQTYGVSRNSIITGLWLGADLTPVGSQALEQYSLYVEDGVPSTVELASVHFSDESRLPVRVPADGPRVAATPG